MVVSMNMYRFLTSGGFLAAALLVSSLAAADEPSTDQAQATEALHGALAVVDMVPTRAALDSLGVDVPSLLRAAVLDPEGSRYHRQRALSFLGMYPSNETRAFLMTCIGEGAIVDPNLQRLALHSLAMAFGQNPDDELMAVIQRELVSEDRELRREAVRALRWVASADAVALLESVLVSPDADATMRVLATRSLERHVGGPVATGVEQ